MANSYLKKWFKSGSPWVWLNAGAVAISLVMVVGLLWLIAVRGMGYFWPGDVAELEYREADGRIITLLGEFVESETVSAEQLRHAGFSVPRDKKRVTRYLFKSGNRDLFGKDFHVLLHHDILKQRKPKDVVVIERREWGNFYGYLQAVQHDGAVVAEGRAALGEFQQRLGATQELMEKIRHIEKDEIGAINTRLERLRLKERKWEMQDRLDASQRVELQNQRAALEAEYQQLQSSLDTLNQEVVRDSAVLIAGGQELNVPLMKIVRLYQPNAMSVWHKGLHYLAKAWEFVSDEPREANTEGGIFPAIFGTVIMVLVMSILVAPMGIVAAVYLHEYARQGFLTRLVRIAVNNLAGVPAIVYGVFGLGFFVYFLGGSIDQLFYAERLPAPTFGTPGLLWAALTLALLTLPVVIVATEEGLSRIPRAVREGSLALGATKFETLWRIVLPMASPAMMTGMILSVARAAGEVAPLMLVGVVKLAPSLPVDLNEPFLHLERKFMHLGFHIYDVGFQSPNVEAARPLVYATALLLVLVIVVLNIVAIFIRNRLREKYRALEG